MTTDTQIQYPILSLEQKNTKNKLVHLRIKHVNSMYIIHRALVKQMHEKRSGNANSKTRSEIRGGGKKPWKQKGTGRARAGSNRSPLWRGGGVVFGPKSKNYTKKLNNKEKRLALRNLLYNKKSETTIIENLNLLCTQTSTRLFLQQIRELQIDLNQKILIIVSDKNIHIYLSTRNLKNIDIIAANNLNINAIISSQHLIIESKALDIIEKIYNG